MKLRVKSFALLFAVMLMTPISGWAQGEFYFNNRVGTEVDARFVLFNDAPGMGRGHFLGARSFHSDPGVQHVGWRTLRFAV